MNVMRHDFHFTYFCQRCGQSAQEVLNRDLPCMQAANLIPISHIVAERRMNGMVRQVFPQWFGGA